MKNTYQKDKKLVKLGQSDFAVPDICLGTMVFGAQVNAAAAARIMDFSLDSGLNFMDTAEMYAVPPTPETYNATENIIGQYFKANPGKREAWIVATKVAGPSRGMPWIRAGSKSTDAKTIIAACDASLQRLHTDVIDLYQIHWPNRHVPQLGATYYDPTQENHDGASIHEQLEAFAKLHRAGKIKYFGLSNETSYGVHEFVRLAEQHNLPRIVAVQNAYCLTNRNVENGLDETMHRLNVSLLAYSPLAFGLLTGKYDEKGIDPKQGQDVNLGRMSLFASMRNQRWGRADATRSAKRYNQLARDNGLTPTELALAFCYQKWQVASTIIGVTSEAQLDECLAAHRTKLTPEILKEIDAIRWHDRDLAA